MYSICLENVKSAEWLENYHKIKTIVKKGISDIFWPELLYVLSKGGTFLANNNLVHCKMREREGVSTNTHHMSGNTEARRYLPF